MPFPALIPSLDFKCGTEYASAMDEAGNGGAKMRRILLTLTITAGFLSAAGADKIDLSTGWVRRRLDAF
jgi:hypothetical protein